MFRSFLTGILALSLFASLASAQTVDELIAKNVQARGGMDKLKSVKSVKVHGKMIMGQGMEAPFTMMQKRPKMTRTEFTVMGMTGMQVYDGKNAWMVMPFMGKKDPEAMPADQADMLDEQSDMDGPLVDYKEKGHKVELAGKEQVEGADAHKLKVTLKNGQVRYIYLDAETGLEVKTEAKRKVRGTEIDGETFMSDYKEVEGMMMPFTMESGAKGSTARQKMVLDSIRVNPPIEDSLFAMPAGTKPAAPVETKADAKAAEKADSKAAKADAKAVKADAKAVKADAKQTKTAEADSAKAKAKKP